MQPYVLVTGPTLEIIRQDFFQEAKTLIAQHYEKINENKFQSSSVSAFKNKYQKRKSGIYLPLEIKKKEVLDVVREIQSPYKNIYSPKDFYKTETFEEPSKRVSSKEPRLFNVKEKHKESRDQFAKVGEQGEQARGSDDPRRAGRQACYKSNRSELLGVARKVQENSKMFKFGEQLLFVDSMEDRLQDTKVGDRNPSEGAVSSPEQVKLGKIVTDIESVSKKMEKKKRQQRGKSRMLEAFPIHLSLPLHPLTSSSTEFLKENGKAFYDWRGIVLTRSFCLPQESIQTTFSASSILPDYCTKTIVKKEQQPIKPEPKPQTRIKSVFNKSEKSYNKVRRIGPHIEIFQVFQERNKFVITKKVVRMITIMQARVRGWLERKRYQRIRTKALYHGPNLRIVINMYRRMIHRIRYRLGLWRTREIINFTELEEWMDRKKFYEIMFTKREDWQGLERSELLKYFNECGHFPTQKQIDGTWNLVNRKDQEKYSELITKSKAVEMLFTLYPPQGAHVYNNAQLKSTWLRPIVNGEEGYKYIVNGHPILKRANIQIVGKLVAGSMRERKMKEYYKSLNIQ
ncbi:IQ domain-containing protein M [Choloepus didactylus]|uniref:IQ domain-containing protein M n=1 Tax=Choloepus didactylus TaxID=27675 RepID=UPI0018A09DCA|nr:IQ domain-containing protein M [Choloepus didactylus]